MYACRHPVAAWLVKSLCAIYKKVIGVIVSGACSNKYHRKPPYIKAHGSMAQKTSKYFAIKKGGAWYFWLGKDARPCISAINKKERGTYKYYYPIAFKLQHW